MYCENCGKLIEEGNKFCPYCGTKVIETENKVEKEVLPEAQTDRATVQEKPKENTKQDNMEKNQDVPKKNSSSETENNDSYTYNNEYEENSFSGSNSGVKNFAESTDDYDESYSESNDYEQPDETQEPQDNEQETGLKAIQGFGKKSEENKAEKISNPYGVYYTKRVREILRKSGK